MLIKVADETKLSGIASTLEGRIKSQNDVDKLENRSDKCKVHLGL